ncbi:MAG: hypothetical protein IH624_09620 [Phycisphaerae bacterium]|nr:hypothetical protein [Phycisphaerae bacterium]
MKTLFLAQASLKLLPKSDYAGFPPFVQTASNRAPHIIGYSTLLLQQIALFRPRHLQAEALSANKKRAPGLQKAQLPSLRTNKT